MLTLVQIKFCAEEVTRQGDDAMAVYHMCDAFDHIVNDWEANRTIDIDCIRYLADKTNGGKFAAFDNLQYFRTIPVTFHGIVGGANPEHIKRQLLLLCDAWNGNNTTMLFPNYTLFPMTPEEFYQRFEEIHPFVDGNGRVGALLYNYLCDTLRNPIAPPKFKE